MAYRSKYNRRLRAVKRLQKRLAVAALLGAAACAAGFLLLREPATMAPGQSRSADATPARPALQSVQTAAASEAHAGARRVYPFSVVPGGLSGRVELLHAVRTDRVVAQHYAGLQVEKVGTVKVSKPRAVYVSYRKGDKVYWTSKKVMLAAGETLLSDGDNQIRTRCGNRISDVARLPVEADGPSAEVLDTAMSMDEDGGDGQRQADAGPQNAGADGVLAAGQPVYLSSTTYGSGPAAAPATPGVPASLALVGSAAAAPGTPNLLSPLTMIGQIGTPTTSSTSSTSTGSGKSGTSGAPATGIVTDSGGDTGTPSATAPVLGPTDDHPAPAIPPVPEPMTRPGTLPTIHPQSPAKPSEVPEPGTLWLSGTTLALVLLRRRKPRARRG